MINRMQDDLHKEAVSLTPVDTGRAKRGWRKNREGTSNDVPYIAVLDRGRKAGTRKGSKKTFMQGSDQAKDGISKPALNRVKDKLKRGTYLK